MIAALLAKLGIQQWVFELIVLVIVAGGIWYWQHERYEAGIAAQIAIDAAERAQLIKDNDKKTADLQAKATMAEQTYDKEHQSTVDYGNDNPLQPIRLCLTTPKGGSHLPSSGSKNPGNVSTSTPATNLQPMPSGNSSSGPRAAGPDVSELLDLLAGKADDVSGVLREYQNREK